MNKNTGVSTGYFSQLSKLATVAVLLATLTSYSGWHLFELAAHFRPVWFVAGLLLVIYWLSLRYKYWVFVAVLIIAVNAWHVLPWYWSNQHKAETAQLSVLLSNVNSANTSATSLIQWIGEKDPDLFVVQEVTPAFASQLAVLNTDYPYQLMQSERGNFGIGALSKYPLTTPKLQHFGAANVPSLTFELQLPNQTINIIATHPMPPITGSLHALRNDQFAELARWQSGLNGSVLLIGDLNTTVWGKAYRELTAQTGLLNARNGFGISATWPAGFSLLGIDHVLHSPELEVQQFEVGPNVGSDHLPIWVAF